jgi:hypothetical protein
LFLQICSLLQGTEWIQWTDIASDAPVNFFSLPVASFALGHFKDRKTFLNYRSLPVPSNANIALDFQQQVISTSLL